MKSMNISEIVESTDGILFSGDENTVITSVCIDSRDIKDGTLFVPMIGEKTDAHEYVSEVFKCGAAASLTSDKDISVKDGAIIYVKDTKLALQKIAAHYRNKFSIPIIGVTGSVGKTSTREMIATVLSKGKNILSTFGNFNSQIGLPLTVLRIEDEHEVAVLEMGMSEFGEMQRISEVAKPTSVVLTNIGISHIETLKTQENIRSEKLHIADYINESGTVYLNSDDALLRELNGKLKYRTITFGIKENADFRAFDIKIDGDTTQFKVETKAFVHNFNLHTVGEHNVLNALAAIAIAIDLGLDLKTIQSGLNEYKSPNMRQTIHNLSDITVIDDSYNASPDSLKSGLNVLKETGNGSRLIAVLADMLELGEYSKSAHYRSGKLAADMGIDVIVTIGKESLNISKGALDTNEKIAVNNCENNDQALNILRNIVKSGDTILVKGSRGMHTEKIVDGLLRLYCN